MKIKYKNATGAARKEMVRVIEGATGQKARYLGMPTAAYQIDFLTVERDGTLAASGIYVTEREVLDKVLQALDGAGFEREKPAYDDSARLGGMYQRNEQTGQLVKLVSDDQCALTVYLPRDSVNVGNLEKLLEQKGALIRKALGIVSTVYGWSEDEVWFPWWHTTPTPEETQAYIDFICAICKVSKERTRINKTAERGSENEKYAFRCFLLRLGFVGKEYSADRKILLRNLTGDAAFKKGGDR
jgi:hypothetical protein